MTVAGASPTPRTIGGVAWLPPGPIPQAEATVAVNDASLLPESCARPTVWFHNEVEFWREARKARLPALWRHRPAAVFIGREQARHAAFLLPFARRHVIPYGLPDRVRTAAPAAAPPPPHAAFTSQAYRGLREVIALWRRAVAPQIPHARLAAYIDAKDVPAYAALAAGAPSITVAPRIGNDGVLGVLRGARLLLAPGHRSETFCMAAAEAIAMGVPVITRGIGALKERVANNATGYTCRSNAEMAQRTRQVLTDDALWSRLHAAGVATRAGNGWDRAAKAWEEAILPVG